MPPKYYKYDSNTHYLETTGLSASFEAIYISLHWRIVDCSTSLQQDRKHSCSVPTVGRGLVQKNQKGQFVVGLGMLLNHTASRYQVETTVWCQGNMCSTSIMCIWFVTYANHDISRPKEDSRRSMNWQKGVNMLLTYCRCHILYAWR